MEFFIFCYFGVALGMFSRYLFEKYYRRNPLEKYEHDVFMFFMCMLWLPVTLFGLFLMFIEFL